MSVDGDGRLRRLCRVALVTGNYVNVADGVSLTLHRLVEGLQARGVEVTVVAPAGSHPRLDPATQMIELPSMGLPIQKGYRLALGIGARTTRALREFDPQIVHVATPDLAGWMSARYARRRGITLIGTYHTNFASYLRYWGLLPSALTSVAWQLTRRFYEGFDQVYVPTRSFGQELVERGVLERFEVLARGVDAERFHPRHHSRQWRRCHGIGDREQVVLFCARIVWEKGLRTLVRALNWLHYRGPKHRCVVVGDGDQRAWLERHLPHAIFTGYLSHPQLAQAYASADLFVYPSTTDTFGNVTLEAMSSGLPVVGARAPGTRTLVDDGQSGVLVEPDDPTSLANETSRLLDDDRRRRRLAKGARRRAREFRWSQIVGGFADSLDRLVAWQRSTPRGGETGATRH